jgi:hypothetical protein
MQCSILKTTQVRALLSRGASPTARAHGGCSAMAAAAAAGFEEVVSLLRDVFRDAGAGAGAGDDARLPWQRVSGAGIGEGGGKSGCAGCGGEGGGEAPTAPRTTILIDDVG